MIGKILAWNVCGINDNVKRGILKSLAGSIGSGIYCFCETKIRQMDQWIVRDLCNWRLCGWEALNSIGASGGILVAWNDDLFEKMDVDIGRFSVSVQFKNRSDNFRWVMSAVYGPVLHDLKTEFFNELSRVASLWDLPIIFAGDMNEVRYPSERNGARRVTRFMSEFSSVIEHLELLDPPLEGGQYTFRRGNGRGGSSQSRIDRFLVNEPIFRGVANIFQRVLPWSCSDHRPILLERKEVPKIFRPFRFENKWLIKDDFMSRVHEWWRTQGHLGSASSKLFDNLKNLRTLLKTWYVGDRTVFCAKVKDLCSKINVIDGIEEVRDLLAEEVSCRILLVSNLLELCKEEEIGARQRSRAIWLREGDKNTKFFHGVSKARARNNAINLISIQGIVHDSEPAISDNIVQFYRDLFKETYKVRPKLDAVNFDAINEEQKIALEAQFTEEEVEAAIMSCGSDKAPGSDGFTLAFYKKMWPFIKCDIMNAIKHFYQYSSFDKSWNSTLLCLIRKAPGTVDVKNFRPISLVSSFYKIVSKCLANRLRGVFESVISANQMAFIKGRQIFDASLIANECIDSANSNDAKCAFVKLDIEKAYDHVNWEFLFDVMGKMGMGEKWIGWIKFCVSTAKFSILVNGSHKGFFESSRGIRQGDPLSPFLFVIVMEALSKMMVYAESAGLIRGVDCGSRRSSFIISHLLFADDTLCMIHATHRNFKHLRDILWLFGACSGLRVNLGKSQIFFSNSVSNRRKMALASILGFGVGSFPSTYLGMPLGAKARSKTSWDPIISKMERKLAIWKSKMISKGGRLVLIKSALASMPTYMMSLFMIPKSVAVKIEKIMCKFLWGSSESSFRHLVSWDKVKKYKDEGGLGIRDLISFNKALLSKWCSRYSTEPNSLWATMIKCKYGQDWSGWFTKPINRPVGCGIWGGISKMWKSFRGQCRFSVGDGSSISFWDDNWCSVRSLSSKFPGLASIAICRDATVKDMFDQRTNGFARRIRYRRRLTEEELILHERVILIVGHKEVNISVRDSLRWQDIDKFHVGHCYSIIAENAPYDYKWEKLWDSKIPSKISFFGWSVMHGGILTDDRCMKKGCIMVSRCRLCHKNVESASHLLLHCEGVVAIWSLLWNMIGIQWVMPESIDSCWEVWLETVCSVGLSRWAPIPIIFWWTIWLERNRRTFSNKNRPMRFIHNAIIMTIGEVSSGKPVEAVGELIDLLEDLRVR